MILYHYARREHVHSIMMEGLRVNSGKRGLSSIYWYEERHGMQPIFLTDDPKLVEAMDSRVHKHSILLEVDCAGFEILPEHDYSKIYIEEKFWPKGPQHTFICKSNIPADRIKVHERNSCLAGSNT